PQRHILSLPTRRASDLVATVGAHHDQIDAVLPGEAVHLARRLADDHVGVHLEIRQLAAQLGEALGGLGLELVLDFAEVHGDIPTVGEGQWLLYVDEADFAILPGEQRLDVVDDLLGFRREVESDQNALVVGHALTPAYRSLRHESRPPDSAAAAGLVHWASRSACPW